MSNNKEEDVKVKMEESSQQESRNTVNEAQEADSNNYEVETWRCTECGIVMGPNNPRQLCGKTYCMYK